MDNSPVFDENNKLDPEAKQLYERVIAQKSSRKSSKIISDYYNLLKANNFHQFKGIDKFLKANGLYSMLSMQPDTR